MTIIIFHNLLLLLVVYQVLESPVVSSFAITSSMATSTATNTLGPNVLRKITQESSTTIQSQSLDLGNILWFEHINLVVGDMETATKFYIDFLGFTPERAANPKSNHFNIGQQQFHLAAATNGDSPQRVTGSIGLTVPSLQRIRDRVGVAKKELEGTLFSVAENENKNIMTVTCPWANVIHLYDIAIDNEQTTTAVTLSDSTQKMVKLHELGGDYGAHRMAVRGKPGIKYLEVTSRKGSMDEIAQFYKNVLECSVTRIEEKTACAVCVGPGVHFIFAEGEDLKNDAIQQMQGVHACIYISNYKKTYDTLKAKDMIWTNPRFTHLDSCDSWEDAYASRTFRFKDIVDSNTGEKILELEHETRPMMHGQYMKVPPYLPN